MLVCTKYTKNVLIIYLRMWCIFTKHYNNFCSASYESIYVFSTLIYPVIIEASVFKPASCNKSLSHVIPHPPFRSVLDSPSVLLNLLETVFKTFSSDFYSVIFVYMWKYTPSHQLDFILLLCFSERWLDNRGADPHDTINKPNKRKNK